MSSKRWSESKMRGFIHGKKQKDHQQDRGQDDKMETLLWVNRTLANGGNSQYAINDITRDLCDGVALIKLLESMTRAHLAYHSPPLSRSQKLNNVQMVLKAVSERGVSVAGINSEDVFKGNVKVILNLCHRIQQGITVKRDSPKGPPQSSFQKDSLIVWAETILNCKIRDYSDFRDGRYFCDIINSLHCHGKNVRSPSSSAQKCLTNAVQAAEMHFGLNVGPFDVMQVTNGENDTFIQAFLQQLKNVKLQSDVTSFQGNERYSNDRIRSRVPDESWYEEYGTPEERRGYRKTHSVPSRDDSPNYLRQESSNSQIDEQIREGKGNPHKLRVSYSTDHLNSYSNSGSSQSLQFNGNDYKISGRKNRQRLVDEPPVAMQPDSTPNRSSYRQPDMRTSQVTSSYPNIGPQPYSLPSRNSDRVGGARHSLPSSVTTVEYSYSNDLPMPVTIYRTSSRSSIHSTSSRSSMDRGSTTDDQHITLAHLSSHQSSIPPHMNLPEYQTEKSLRDNYSRKRSGSGNSLGNAHLPGAGGVDRLPPAIDNLDRRLVELSEIMLEEKVVLMKKTFKTVAMETRKRRQLEKRFEDYVKTSKSTIQRYESCLVHLGKEVSRLSMELSKVKEQMSVMESEMNKPKPELSSHATISPGESSGTEKGKKSIFSRKPK